MQGVRLVLTSPCASPLFVPEPPCSKESRVLWGPGSETDLLANCLQVTVADVRAMLKLGTLPGYVQELWTKFRAQQDAARSFCTAIENGDHAALEVGNKRLGAQRNMVWGFNLLFHALLCWEIACMAVKTASADVR